MSIKGYPSLREWSEEDRRVFPEPEPKGPHLNHVFTIIQGRVFSQGDRVIVPVSCRECARDFYISLHRITLRRMMKAGLDVGKSIVFTKVGKKGVEWKLI
jgi:hypothetical protein